MYFLLTAKPKCINNLDPAKVTKIYLKNIENKEF